MKFSSSCISLVLLAASSANAFAPSIGSKSSTSKLNIVVGDTAEEFAARVEATFEKAPKKNDKFDDIVQSSFPGAISNQDLVQDAVSILSKKGYDGENTLLATSLCCDELARQLEDDFNGIYGNNFNLGGLAGFPFAGNTGFGAMAAHIPDDGFCLIVYGPHVGIAADGTVGKVERAGIDLIDTCCGSAVAASNYVDSITNGGRSVTMQIQTFTDFQQNAVQELILPHGKRLADADLDGKRMVELPYALYDSQNLLLSEIIKAGSTGIKRGVAILGGIQINTGPDTPDYFHPLRFDYMNYRGDIIDDLLPSLTDQGDDDDDDEEFFFARRYDDDVDVDDYSRENTSSTSSLSLLQERKVTEKEEDNDGVNVNANVDDCGVNANDDDVNSLTASTNNIPTTIYTRTTETTTSAAKDAGNDRDEEEQNNINNDEDEDEDEDDGLLVDAGKQNEEKEEEEINISNNNESDNNDNSSNVENENEPRVAPLTNTTKEDDEDSKATSVRRSTNFRYIIPADINNDSSNVDKNQPPPPLPPKVLSTTSKGEDNLRKKDFQYTIPPDVNNDSSNVSPLPVPSTTAKEDSTLEVSLRKDFQYTIPPDVNNDSSNVNNTEQSPLLLVPSTTTAKEDSTLKGSLSKNFQKIIPADVNNDSSNVDSGQPSPALPPVPSTPTPTPTKDDNLKVSRNFQKIIPADVNNDSSNADNV